MTTSVEFFSGNEPTHGHTVLSDHNGQLWTDDLDVTVFDKTGTREDSIVKLTHRDPADYYALTYTPGIYAKPVNRTEEGTRKLVFNSELNVDKGHSEVIYTAGATKVEITITR